MPGAVRALPIWLTLATSRSARFAGAALVDMDWLPLNGSSRATRQLGDILREGLSRELQPFDRREIREDRLGQLLDREAAFDRERSRLDAVVAFGRDDV